MVESLVAADQLADQGLDLSMEMELSDIGTHAPMPSFEGRSVGSCQVLREIGRGGMGVVYLARSWVATQIEPLLRVPVVVLPIAIGESVGGRIDRVDPEFSASRIVTLKDW